MNRPTRSPVPARLLAAGLVSVASFLTACSDTATAPETRAATPDPKASAIVLKVGVSVKVRMADTTGATLTEPSWVRFVSGNDTTSVRDNAERDQDPATGFIKVTLVKTNQYSACFNMSAQYMRDYTNATYPACRTSTSTDGTVDMGTVFGQRRPMFKMIAKDQFGALVGGASYNILTVDNGWNLTFQDGNPSYDQSPGADGITIYALNFPFMTKICESKPPSKMLLLTTKCYTVDAKWGKTYTYTFTHEQAIY